MSRRKVERPDLTVPKRARDRKRFVLTALLIAVPLLVYAQTWRFGFITVDDPFYVSENPRVEHGVSLSGVVWSFTTIHDSNWIPFTWLSLMFDTSVYGFRPGGYHLTNVFLHLANAVLLFGALAAATGSRLRSAFVAALFALHPLHVESVAWIAERKDVLSTFFGLLSLLTYVRYAQRGRWPVLGASLLFFVCSLMSKQTLVTLPFVFVLLDFWPLGRIEAAATAPKPGPRDSFERRRRGLRLMVEKVPFFAASAAFSVVALVAQSRGGAVRNFRQFPLAERCANAVFAYAAYLGKAFWPRNLAFYYPHPHEALSWTAVGLAAALLLAISAAAIMSWRRYPFLLVGWCWYLGTLVPMIGLVQIGAQQMADRYTYFPLIGVFLAVTWLACDVAPADFWRTRLLPAVAVASVGLLVVITYRQVGLWHDSVTLLRHSKDSTADNSRAHQLLGSALVAEGATGDGIAELETAVRMGGSSPSAHCALGIGLQESGRLDEAAAQYRAALALNEGDADAWSNLGVIQMKRHEYQAAKQSFQRATQIAPEQMQPYVGMGMLCLETGEYAESLASSQRALELDPRSIRARHNLAVALIASGRLDEAIRQFQALVTLLPDDAEARQNLARALALKAGSVPK